MLNSKILNAVFTNRITQLEYKIFNTLIISNV